MNEEEVLESFKVLMAIEYCLFPEKILCSTHTQFHMALLQLGSI